MLSSNERWSLAGNALSCRRLYQGTSFKERRHSHTLEKQLAGHLCKNPSICVLTKCVGRPCWWLQFERNEFLLALWTFTLCSFSIYTKLNRVNVHNAGYAQRKFCTAKWISVFSVIPDLSLYAERGNLKIGTCRWFKPWWRCQMDVQAVLRILTVELPTMGWRQGEMTSKEKPKHLLKWRSKVQCPGRRDFYHPKETFSEFYWVVRKNSCLSSTHLLRSTQTLGALRDLALIKASKFAW